MNHPYISQLMGAVRAAFGPDSPIPDEIGAYIEALESRLAAEGKRSCLNCKVMPICHIRREASILVYGYVNSLPSDIFNISAFSGKVYREIAACCSLYLENHFQWSDEDMWR